MERDIKRVCNSGSEIHNATENEEKRHGVLLPVKKRKIREPRSFTRINKKKNGTLQEESKYLWIVSMEEDVKPSHTILSYSDGTPVRYEDVPLKVREHFSTLFKKNGKGNYKHVYKYCGRKKGEEESGEATGFQVILTGEECQTLIARVADPELGALLISTNDERVLSSKRSAHNWVLWMIKLGEKALEEYMGKEKDKEN